MKVLKNMKRVVCLLLTFAVLTVSLCACTVSTSPEITVSEVSKDENSISVTITANCFDALNKSEVIPDGIINDGYLVPENTYVLEKGTTVYDAIVYACKEADVVLDAQEGSYAGESYTYINSIAGLASGDMGSMSGWVYYVNDQSPDVSCEKYVLKDGDVVRWEFYTEGDNGDDAEIFSDAVG